MTARFAVFYASGARDFADDSGRAGSDIAPVTFASSSAHKTGEGTEPVRPHGRVSVVVASRHGSTFRIASAIRDELAAAGLDVSLFVADSFESFEGADAVVLGSSIYAGRWLGPAEALLNRNASELARVPVWLFSSGPDADASDGATDLPDGIRRAADGINVRDHKVFPRKADPGQLTGEWAHEIATELRDRFTADRPASVY